MAIHDPKFKFIRWVLGPAIDAISKLKATVTHIFIATPIDKQGDAQGFMVGAPAGGVAWPVEAPLHDDMSFVGADSFLAYYNPATREATLLDIVDNGIFEPHPNAKPLVLGTNLFLPQPLNRACVGLVVRTAEYGTNGLTRNVFLAHVGGPGQPDFEITAHHLDPNPNTNSTLVHDPDVAGRKGPVDDQWRVREYNPVNQQRYDATGKTFVVPPPPAPVDDKFCVAWNGFDSGVGENRGHCLTFFGGHLARMSFTMDGPLRPTTEKYFQSETNEDVIHAGGLDVLAKWTAGDPLMDGPHRHQLTFEPPVAIGTGFRHRVDLMFDHDGPETEHPTHIGQRIGMWQWSVRIPLVEMPPCDGIKNPITGGGAPTFDSIGGSEVYFRGNLMGGGLNWLPVPGIHKRAK